MCRVMLDLIIIVNLPKTVLCQKAEFFIFTSSLITPPLDTLTFFDPTIGIRALVSIALVYTPLEEDGRVYVWEY